MPSLLWLTENYPPQRGGMSQSCDRIIYGLRKLDYIVEIIHFTNRGKNSIKRKQQEAGGYVSISYQESESHTINLAWNYIERLGDFDYLVSFGGYLPMIAAPIFSKWKNIKLVTFLRGNDFDTSIFVPRKRKMLEDSLAQSSTIFCVSQNKVMKVSKWLPNLNVHFVANGIDCSQWEATQSEIDFAASWNNKNSKNKVCLGVFGQLKAKKGISFLLKSLRKTSYDTKIHLLFIGDVESNLKEEIENASFSTTVISFQDRYELLKYYLCCDAVLVPSFYDGMPNILLESGALGKPIIGSNVDGISDLIDHGTDGLLFEPGDEGGCRKAIYEFLELSIEERINLGEKLKSKILNQYTARHESKSYQQHLT